MSMKAPSIVEISRRGGGVQGGVGGRLGGGFEKGGGSEGNGEDTVRKYKNL